MLLKHDNLYIDARLNFSDVLNCNISEIENAEYRDDIQMQTQYFEQRNIKATVDELTKCVAINLSLIHI